MHNENLFYLLHSCTNPVLGKSFVPEIWAQNALGQADYKIFKSNRSLEQSDEIA